MAFEATEDWSRDLRELIARSDLGSISVFPLKTSTPVKGWPSQMREPQPLLAITPAAWRLGCGMGGDLLDRGAGGVEENPDDLTGAGARGQPATLVRGDDRMRLIFRGGKVGMSQGDLVWAWGQGGQLHPVRVSAVAVGPVVGQGDLLGFDRVLFSLADLLTGGP